MLERGPAHTIRKLVLRDFRFNPLRWSLLAFTIALVTALYAFSFLMGGSIEAGYRVRYATVFGNTSHIMVYDLTEAEANTLEGQDEVASAVRLSALGQLTSPYLGYQSVQMAVADGEYAASSGTLPDTGRLPQAAGEIALDVSVLDALYIPRELGVELYLPWIALTEGGERTDRFTLVGYWDSDFGYTESIAWISEEAAEALLTGDSGREAVLLVLGLTLHRPGDLDSQAEALLENAGLADAAFATNLAYNRGLMEQTRALAAPFYTVSLFVAACGFLILFSMMRLSARQSIPLYTQIKALGMTPRQLRHLHSGQIALLCVAGIPVGLLAGFGLYMAVSMPLMGGEAAVMAGLVQPWAVAASILLAVLTAWLSGILSFGFVARRTPAETAALTARDYGRDKGRTYKPSTLSRMALRSLHRSGAAPLTLAALLISCLLLCITWTEYVSYDEALYLEAMSWVDYTVSSVRPYHRYNPENRSLTEALGDEISSHPAVTSSGAVKTYEVPMVAGSAMYDRVIGHYSSTDGEGETRRDLMSGVPDWFAGYDRFVETGAYTALAVGLEPYAVEVSLLTAEVIEGELDPEMFAAGGHVVAVGQAATPVGEEVVLGGRAFTVMAVIDYDESFVHGENSPEAAFAHNYYLPMEAFDALYPDTPIRQLVLDIDHSQGDTFADHLEAALARQPYGFTTLSYRLYADTFQRARLTMVAESAVSAIVLLLASLIHYATLLVGRTARRQREFSIYESLGMTGRQVRRLLMGEGLAQAGLNLLVLITLTGVGSWYGSQIRFARMNTWAMTYQFSLLPLWITAALLLVITLAIPQLCLGLLRRGSVAERLRAGALSGQ